MAMSAHPESSGSSWAAIGRGFVAVLLLLYGLLTLFVASAWGPGNSDELVTGGITVVPWFGLPIAGTAAAATSLARVTRPRTASTASALAAVCLLAWTAFLFAITD
jgi:hypothetical protein